MADKMPNVVLENARIGFRNFSGAEGKYNRAGDRNFVIFLEPEIAEQMLEDGWNIKTLQARDEDEEPQHYIQIAINYNGRPPRVVMVTSRGKTSLGEGEIDILDWAEVKSTDVIIRPYEWEVNGKTGIKAYAQSVFITIEEDELERKYVDVPDSASRSIGVRFEED